MERLAISMHMNVGIDFSEEAGLCDNASRSRRRHGKAPSLAARRGSKEVSPELVGEAFEKYINAEDDRATSNGSAAVFYAQGCVGHAPSGPRNSGKHQRPCGELAMMVAGYRMCSSTFLENDSPWGRHSPRGGAERQARTTVITRLRCCWLGATGRPAAD